jgi:hypothetical protein
VLDDEDLSLSSPEGGSEHADVAVEHPAVPTPARALVCRASFPQFLRAPTIIANYWPHV